MLAIFQMTSGFCAQGFIATATKVNAAQAASVAKIANQANVCGDEQMEQKERSNWPTKFEAPKNAHHNAALPCCVDGTHSGAELNYQAFEFIKVTPAIVGIVYHSPLAPLNAVAYHKPIVSPPELNSVQTTILRL